MSFTVRWLSLLALLLIAGRTSAQGQGLVMHVTSSHDSILVSNTAVLTVSITNGLGIQLFNTFLTNTPSSAVSLISPPTPGFTNGVSYVVDLGLVQVGEIIQVPFSIQPHFTGPLTNTFTLFTSSITNTPSTNIVIQVTNVAPSIADLSVGVRGPVLGVVENDLTPFTITVTNHGPGTATGVVLSNSFPADVGFIGISPTNQVTLSSNAVHWTIGSLTNQAVRTFHVLLWPTNAGFLPFFTAVLTSSDDTNAANNTATATIEVGEFVTGQLLASNVTAMAVNRQTGLLEQIIGLSNIGTSTVASAHVIVTGLSNRLYNAVGTNNGDPFVSYEAPLDPGESVNLRMEYYTTNRVPFLVPNSAYQPVGAPAAALDVTNAPGIDITKQIALTNGSFLIEFSSIPGRTYTIFYSSNMNFGQALMAQPPVVAPANRTQWIDDGPPKTSSHPSSETTRFYRVFLNP